MKSHQLHTAYDRQAIFANLDPRVWFESELLRFWVVTDPAVIVGMLRSPWTAISDLNEVVGAVKAKYGIELPNVDYACSVLPVLVSDEVHPIVRKGFATFLAARTAELDAQLSAMVKSCLAPLARAGHVDIVTEVVRPFLRQVFSVFLGAELPAQFQTIHVIEVLSFKATVGHLKDIDSRIETTLDFLRRTTSDQREIDWKFICLIFGLDSMSMMLTEGLVTALRASDPTRAGAAKLPDFPVETGVPVSHRRVKRDLEIEGYKFAAGDMVRLQMQALGYSPNPDHRKFMFGGGAHSCVGKQLSLRIWEAFRREFDALEFKGRVAHYRLMPSHFIVFHDKVEIEVLP